MTSVATEDDLLLRFSHNVVEHLGLKLYQNKPTNVIAEIVSNSWDADATRVEVNMSMDAANRWVAVHDNGHGMTREELASPYLIIGLPRRTKADETSRGRHRRLMGRKGIGKLAPFGIARQMDVLTSALKDGEPVMHWLRFNLDDLLKQREGSYKPTLVVSGGQLEKLPLDEDPTGSQVTDWRDSIVQNKTGTLILMTKLSLGRAINDGQLIDSLGHRFTITVGHDFSVSVNGLKATAANMLPEFDFRIPEQGHTAESINGREVQFWVGFVKKADWPADQAGVGVYSHGKIAQDRPFTFGIKGKEIFTRYMFGVVEAEWLDELDQDVISTDRTSVNWELAETKPLYEWGQRKVGSWVGRFEEWRGGLEQEDNRKLVHEVTRAGQAPKVTEPEEEEIVRLVSSITPSLGKDTEEKKRLVKAVSEAWVQTPMRKLVRDLWSSVGKGGDMPPAAFTKVVERLSVHSVPESLNLAVVFAQRAFALTRLHDYVHHGDEVDLQKLVEKFPWIVEPDLAVLTANQQLKTAIEKAETLGQIPKGRRVNVGGVPDKNKPDFVFLSSPEERQIVIVELKNPQEDLTIDNRKQLEDYMTWFEAHYPDAEISGFLIGRKPNRMKPKYEGLTILPWTDVLQRSRARNLELLAAMLLRTGSGGVADARAADAIQLGGPEAKALLERLAYEHKEIRDLMNSFEIVNKQAKV
ncbi:MAG TPA: ATP-binding protein [Vicinamibacterales bacterium]